MRLSLSITQSNREPCAARLLQYAILPSQTWASADFRLSEIMAEHTRYARVDGSDIKDSFDADTGWLRAPARITRTGVFDYMLADGTLRRELRRPEDVFHPESIASLQMVPVTLGHPREFLDANTTRDHAVGYTGQDITHDEIFVTAPLCITDHTTVNTIKAGIKEISAGYEHAGLDMTHGFWNGEEYDCIQLGPYKYNHVAVVPKGRAGPQVHVLDDADSIRWDGVEMAKLKIDDNEYEVPSAVADAYKGLMDRCDDFKSKLDAAEKAKADDDAKAKGDDDASKRADSAAIETAFKAGKARAQLETTCAAHLGADYRMDGVDDLALVTAAVAKAAPDYDATGKSVDRLLGVLETAADSKRMDAYKPLLQQPNMQNQNDPMAKALADYNKSVEVLAANTGTRR